MTQHQRNVFVVAVAIAVLFMSALFPPRKASPHAHATNFPIPRAFLFSPRSNEAARRYRTSDGPVGETKEPVEIDAGRLLAEVLLVLSVVAARFALNYRR